MTWVPNEEERKELGELGSTLMESITGMTVAAQNARQSLTLERLDKMTPDLLEVEKASRNARISLAAIAHYVDQRR